MSNNLVERSAMAVVFCNEFILTTKEDIYGKIVLSLPKGHVEAGENNIDAAIRECFEETNVVLTKENAVTELAQFKIFFTNHLGDNVEKIITPILFTVREYGNPKPTEKRVKHVEFIDVNVFLRDCAYDNVKAVVRSALEYLAIQYSNSVSLRGTYCAV